MKSGNESATIPILQNFLEVNKTFMILWSRKLGVAFARSSCCCYFLSSTGFLSTSLDAIGLLFEA
jgi:hypothetical protein